MVVTKVRTTVRRKRRVKMEKLISSCVASGEKNDETKDDFQLMEERK